MSQPSLPSDTNLKLWKERLHRAKRKREDWLRETLKNVEMGNNAPQAWQSESPVPYDRTGKTTLVVRNTIGQNARQEVNRIMPKEPKWLVKPVVPIIFEEVNGQQVEQDNSARSAILQTAANYLSNAINLPDELERNALDGEYGNVSFNMVGYLGAGDIPHTATVPFDSRSDAPVGVTELSPGEKKLASRPGIAHGSVKPYQPSVVRLAFDKVLVDPDARTVYEVNWYAHLVARPFPAMEEEKVNEVDYEAQKVTTRPKYRNLDKLKPNAKPEDLTKIQGLYPTGRKDGYQEDFLQYWEVHYRVPSQTPEETKDGFEYWIMSFVDNPDGMADGDPVCIRHEPYPIDIGGFYITMYFANLVNDDLLGFVPGIRDSKGPATLFNTVASQVADWTVRSKVVHWYNKNALQDEDAENLANAATNDWVPLDVKQNVPPEMLMGVVPAVQLPDSVIGEQSFLASITDAQSGRSDNQRGAAAGVRTATEASTIAQEAQGQIASKQKKFRRFAAEVMRKCLVIFTHVLPEDGDWYIPDAKGKFLRFQKRDLFACADVELDLTSQILRDDNVVVQQGMQLMDMLSKVLMAPPQILEKMMPLIERVIASMGPDWESKAKALIAPEQEANDPRNEHLMFAAGEYVSPDQGENLQEHHDLHRAMLMNGPRDPALSKLFNSDSPGLILLAKHLEETEALMQAKGMGIEGGGAKRNRGRGVGSGSVPQAAPSNVELAASASTPQGAARTGSGMRGRM